MFAMLTSTRSWIYMQFSNVLNTHLSLNNLRDTYKTKITKYINIKPISQQIFTLCSGASAIADEYFRKCNGQRAHTLAVIGNCHIDSAWLWPYSETKRKVARSFSSQLKLMEDYPEHLFVASQVHILCTNIKTIVFSLLNEPDGAF